MRWEITHNHLRNVLFDAVVSRDRQTAIDAYKRLKSLGPNPAAAPDDVQDTATAATTLDITLLVVPMSVLRHEVASLLAEAGRWDPAQFVRLVAAGRGVVALGRLALRLVQDETETLAEETTADLVRLFEACSTAAQQVASWDTTAAVGVRELDLLAALVLNGDPAVIRDRFLAIVAHNDIGLLKSRTLPQLLSSGHSGRTLLEVVDHLAAEGQFSLVGRLLDRVTGRAVRLAVARTTNVEGEGFQWDESTWATLLGSGSTPPRTDTPDLVVRFWVHDDVLRLLAHYDADTSLGLVTIDGFTALVSGPATVGTIAVRRTVVQDRQLVVTDETLPEALSKWTRRATDLAGCEYVPPEFSRTRSSFCARPAPVDGGRC
jgi:hypothetical protein